MGVFLAHTNSLGAMKTPPDSPGLTHHFFLACFNNIPHQFYGDIEVSLEHLPQVVPTD